MLKLNNSRTEKNSFITTNKRVFFCYFLFLRYFTYELHMIEDNQIEQTGAYELFLLVKLL
ncbi:hypothetical protein ASE46_01840 [Bacillus sp. Root239]|nr:hypothetical protein ASE46_01840 [Bacillus sp. Root239]